MLLWQSVQVLLPTNVAPGMAGAEIPEVEVVEHEFTSRALLPATPRKTAPEMIRPQFIPDYVQNLALPGSSHKRRCLRLRFAAS